MTIAPTGSTTATTTTPAPTTGGLAGNKDEFLKMFMAQLQHQDPLNPKEGSDMVAQLAQFSAVEQATQTNKYLADLATAQLATSSTSLSTLVGRTCNAGAAGFELDGGGPVPALAITATGVMKGAAVVVSDADGKEVRRIPIADGAASAQLSWDGKTANGVPAAPGTYRVAIDPGTTSATITAQWHGRVDAVELTDTGARLRMGGVLLSPAAVRTIGQSTLTTQSGSGVTQ